MARVQLITFDLDDTLWHAGPVITRATTLWFEFLCENFPRFAQRFDVNALLQLKNTLAQLPQYQHQVSALRIALATQALLQCGYAEGEACSGAQRAFEVFLDARHEVELFADVETTLAQLAPQYRLGVITNGNAQIARLGLDRFFAFMISAEGINLSKPDQRVFERALQLAGVKAEHAVHIGDQPRDDIEGAQRAGLRTIWFNPHNQPWDRPFAPDAQVHGIAGLVEVIGELDRD